MKLPFFHLYPRTLPSLVFLFLLPILICSCKKEPQEPSDETVTDIDGNVYKTVKIGNQTWMAENLRTVHYRNGDPVEPAPSDDEWTSNSGVYCCYENNADYTSIYGLLYNWYAVTDSRKIAPEGWHVPTNEEWKTLIDFIGGDSVAGGRLKERGTNHWNSPNIGANDQFGFTSLPAGWRWGHGPFAEKGICAAWWTSSDWPEVQEFTYAIDIYNSNIRIDCGYFKQKTSGFSLRCIKD